LHDFYAYQTYPENHTKVDDEVFLCFRKPVLLHFSYNFSSTVLRIATICLNLFMVIDCANRTIAQICVTQCTLVCSE